MIPKLMKSSVYWWRTWTLEPENLGFNPRSVTWSLSDHEQVSLNFLIPVVKTSILCIYYHTQNVLKHELILLPLLLLLLLLGISTGGLVDILNLSRSKTECLICWGPQTSSLPICSDSSNGITIHLIIAYIKNMRAFLNSSASFISNNQSNRKPQCPYLHSTS